MHIQLHCPNCEKPIDSEEMRFCPFCGAALPTAAPENITEASTDRMRQRYEAYAAWVEDALSEREIGRVLTAMFTGNRAFKNSPEHEKFLVDVQSMGETLNTAYHAGQQRETLPALLQYVLLDCHRDTPQETDWMFMAAERVFLPMLELLTQEEAAALYPAYRQLRKKQPGLETQKNIRKQLKQIAKL